MGTTNPPTREIQPMPLDDATPADNTPDGDLPDDTGQEQGTDTDPDNRDNWSADQWREFAAAQVAEAEKWKATSRKHEDRSKSNAQAVRELEELKRSSLSDAEKAIEEARVTARAEALAEIGTRLVDAEFRAATAGRMSDGQRDALLDGLDRRRFLTDDGDVDTDKVRALVDGIAPTKAATPRPKVDIGQGRRGSSSRPTVASGAALYAERHKTNTQ